MNCFVWPLVALDPKLLSPLCKDPWLGWGTAGGWLS